MSGRGDNEFISHYLPRFVDFLDAEWSDYHAPYGTRIRKAGRDEREEYDRELYVDQMEAVYYKLKKDPNTRQAVICLWDTHKDNLQKSLDYPCNNLCYLKIRDGKLHWTQTIRSNDLIFGTGTNIFQFSHLMEIMSGWLGVEMGTYTQVVDSLHVYQKDFYDKEKLKPNEYDIYDIFKPQDARMSKKEFDIMLENYAMDEEHWRKGELLDSSIDTGNDYWDNFFRVIKIFNCVKYNEPKQAIFEWDSMTNEYRIPVEKYLRRKKVIK